MPPSKLPLIQRVDAALARLGGLDHELMEQEEVTLEEQTVTGARLKVAGVLAATPTNEQKRQAMFQGYQAACQARNYQEAIFFLEERQKLGEEPALAIEHGKLCLVIGDFQKAYGIFRVVCRKYQEWKLTAEQAHEALWFLFKSWSLQEISEVTEHLFRKKHIKLLEEIEDKFTGVVFLDVFQAIGMTVAYRRGSKTQEIPGVGRETGYDETIRRGESHGIFPNLRMEGERRRLMGASFLKKADNGKDLLNLFKGSEKERKKSELLAWVEKAREHNQAGLNALRHLPTLESAGGEMIRTLYNHAKNLVLRAQIYPGQSQYLDEAIKAIKALRDWGKTIGNPDIIARADLVESDLIRFGIREQPGRDELEPALKANLRALDASEKPKKDVAIEVAINGGEMLLEMGETEAAKHYIARAMQIYTTPPHDQRILDAREDRLRKLCSQVGFLFRKPVINV